MNHNNQQPGSADLLPCPFCGSTNIDPAEWSGNDGKAGPGCGDCGALADSAELWNKRAAPVSAGQAVQVAMPERDESKPTEQQGLFRKFHVLRVDGSDGVGGKHFGCRYYVLDLTHDQHAPAAMRAYASACRATHPQLAVDIEADFGAAPVTPPDGAMPEHSQLTKLAWTRTGMDEYSASTEYYYRAADVQSFITNKIEQYHMQMAGISTAALGYWKEGDGVHPDYDTIALRDVAKLYAKYEALAKDAAQPAERSAAENDREIALRFKREADALWKRVHAAEHELETLKANGSSQVASIDTLEFRAQLMALYTAGVAKMNGGEDVERIIKFVDQRMSAPERSDTPAARDVLAERRRQVEQEGWTPEHDDKYTGCELAAASATYALCERPEQLKVCGVTAWPFPFRWWKPGTYRRNLVKAGALLLAEIERMDRIDGDKQGAPQGDTK